VKLSTDAPVEGIRQGASSASNVALFQLKYGVRVDGIVIPVIGSNVYLMQFAVVMLKPSFPMLVMLSPVLDLTDNTMLLESARSLCCVTILASHPLILHRSQVKLTNIPRPTVPSPPHRNTQVPRLQPLRTLYVGCNLQTSRIGG